MIHLYSPKGALLNTITNPQPTNEARFGYSLAVVGNDRFNGFDAAGASALSPTLILPTIDNTWRVFRIPLDPAGVPAQISGIMFQNLSSSPIATFDLDSISFRW